MRQSRPVPPTWLKESAANLYFLIFTVRLLYKSIKRSVINIGELVKSHFIGISVIPAKAGIQ